VKSRLYLNWRVLSLVFFPIFLIYLQHQPSSERTLKRELANSNTTYSSLLQSKKFELAKKLIESNRNIQEISDLLGYSHISAFSRAFFGWTGKKPSEYIREQRISIKNYYLKKSKY